MTLSNVEVTEHDNNHIFYDESSVVDLVTIMKINPDHALKKHPCLSTAFLPQFISSSIVILSNLFIPHYIMYDVPFGWNNCREHNWMSNGMQHWLSDIYVYQISFSSNWPNCYATVCKMTDDYWCQIRSQCHEMGQLKLFRLFFYLKVSLASTWWS